MTEYVTIPKSAVDWLLGEGPDAHGDHFEPPVTGQRYWWRRHFRKLISEGIPPVDHVELADVIRRGIKDQGYGYTLKGSRLTVSSDETFAIDLDKLAGFIRTALTTMEADHA